MGLCNHFTCILLLTLVDDDLMVRKTLNCFTIIKCHDVLAMPNSMQHIANKTFLEASFLIWVRVGYQFTKRARYMTTSKQLLPRRMFRGSIIHQPGEMFCQPTVKIKMWEHLPWCPPGKFLEQLLHAIGDIGKEIF
jgi:hypothetical protein